MIKLQEVTKLKQVHTLLKGLSTSPVPIVKDNSIQMLAIAHQLLLQVDPDFNESILEYE